MRELQEPAEGAAAKGRVRRPGGGRKVRSELDTSLYPAGLTVSDREMETLNLQTDAFHGEWNYSLLPRQRLPVT